MARIEKTVFISYRRTDVYTALAVYENLKNQGYDVFFDYRSISSGDFEQIISGNIRARAHFLLILTPTAMDRCNEPGDWLRREIEIAIDEKRNIVPLFFKGFRFGASSVTEKLTGKLKNLSRYNGLNVHEDYFDEAMHRLRTQYLNRPLNTVLHPVSTEVRKVVKEEQLAADKALEQFENIKELVKQPEAKRNEPQGRISSLSSKDDKHVDKSGTSQDHVISEKRESLLTPKLRLFIIVASILLLVPLCIMASANFAINNLFEFVTVTSSTTNVVSSTITSRPERTNTPSSTRTPVPLTQTSNPPTPTLGIGSTMTGKDGMTLVYVPAGEFMMGSNNGTTEERPAHPVHLDTYWIDQTEVTVKMYYLCVSESACKDKSPYTQTDFFSNPEFNEYPMILASWEDATTYCSWAGRRLPTEAEWEKAARGENGFIYPWGNDFDGARVNFCDKNCLLDSANTAFDDGFAETAPVGSYPKGASPYGALDMAGNVWELVADWYDAEYYAGFPDSNPHGPESGKYRVMRGGSWATHLEFGLRSSYRSYLDPNIGNQDIGFRCALSADP